MDAHWDFFDASGTQVPESRAQFKAKMAKLPNPTRRAGGGALQWLYHEIQSLDAPAVKWRCKTLDDLRVGIAYYIANYRWPTVHRP